MSVNVYVAIATLATLCFLLPVLLFLFIKNQKVLKITAICFLLVYLALLGFGVFGNVSLSNRSVVIDLRPEGEFFKAASFIYYNFSLVNICVNLFMFIPVGMALYVLLNNHRHKFWWALILSLFLSGLIEFGQFALPVARTVELTDLLYNTISGVLGFLIFFVIDLVKIKIKNR